MTITPQSTKNDILNQIILFLGTYIDPNGRIMVEPEKKRDKRTYNQTNNRYTITNQLKKVGKSTSPNRVNRSSHSICQPRSTGGNH